MKWTLISISKPPTNIPVLVFGEELRHYGYPNNIGIAEYWKGKCFECISKIENDQLSKTRYYTRELCRSHDVDVWECHFTNKIIKPTHWAFLETPIPMK